MLGEKTRSGEQVRALSLSNERQHDNITGVNGLEIVVSSIQSVKKTDLMDGREVWENELTIHAAHHSETLAAFDIKIKQIFGLDNVTHTHLHDGQEFATAIGAGSDAYFDGIVDAATYKLITGAPKYIGKADDIADAPKDGTNYTRRDGSWVQGIDISLDDAAGYFFQNSHYFSDGLNHDTNPDVVEELAADTNSVLKFSDDTPGEFGEYLQADHQDHDHGGDTSLDHFYDRETGVITLHHAKPAEFVLVRIAIDITPDSDNSSADIILQCQANGASGGFTFEIEEQLVSLNQGADSEYAAVASIPIFIGDTLSENPMGSPATITPIVRLRNTTGDIKPRSLAFFIWS